MIKSTRVLVVKWNQRVPAALVSALRLGRVAIDERPVIHRMFEASHFMFQGEFLGAVLGVDDVFKAKLMIAHVLGNQTAALEVRKRPGKVSDINGNMMAVIGRR